MSKNKIDIEKGKYWSQMWNPITGCTPFSIGCDHCWARRMAERLPVIHTACRHEGFDKIIVHLPRMDAPIKWMRSRIVATCWMGDLFHAVVPDYRIAQVFSVMRACPQHIFLVLTKRSDRMSRLASSHPAFRSPNIWLGVTVENQETASTRIPDLARIPGINRWISYEPALGPLGLSVASWSFLHLIHWIVAGGETGRQRNSRPVDKAWFADVRDSCHRHDIPFFFKSYGDCTRAYRKIDGIVYDEFPPAMQAIVDSEIQE